MLKEETIMGLNSKERLDRRVEEKDDVTIAIKWATMQGSALIKGTHIGTMIKITLKAIKGMVGQMVEVKEKLEIKEEENPSRRQENLGMNLMLLTISKMNSIYQRLSLLLLPQTRWEIGLLIVVPQGTSLVTKKLSMI